MIKPLKVFRVNWRVPGAGAYIPPDPCVSSGGCFGDKFGSDMITCFSKEQAIDLVQKARGPSAIIRKSDCKAMGIVGMVPVE